MFSRRFLKSEYFSTIRKLYRRINYDNLYNMNAHYNRHQYILANN